MNQELSEEMKAAIKADQELREAQLEFARLIGIELAKKWIKDHEAKMAQGTKTAKDEKLNTRQKRKK